MLKRLKQNFKYSLLHSSTCDPVYLVWVWRWIGRVVVGELLTKVSERQIPKSCGDISGRWNVKQKKKSIIIAKYEYKIEEIVNA